MMQAGRHIRGRMSNFFVNNSRRRTTVPEKAPFRFIRMLRTAITIWVSLVFVAVAQNSTSKLGDTVTIYGTVINSAGKPVGEALVRLEQESKALASTTTNSAGDFTFSGLMAGNYVLGAEHSGMRSRPAVVLASSAGKENRIDLVLEDSVSVEKGSTALSQSSAQPMEFADKPNFTVAGITDWTAAGGHGSDSNLRTSEALVRETTSLKTEDSESGSGGTLRKVHETDGSESKLRTAVAHEPASYEANHQLGDFYLHAGRSKEAIPVLQAAYRLNPADHANEYDLALANENAGDFSEARRHVKELLAQGETAEWDRLAGELDEKLNDPLKAVHEYERATLLEPSEANYFQWGSELLLHRAVWQAQEVFQRGARAYPQSARMLAALGAALFAGARYNEAALRFCEASDLNPSDPKPYEYMGKIEMAAPNPLACIDQKLARFVQQQPENANANYFYAMTIWKEQEHSADKLALRQVETLLRKAVAVDPQCADGYLQLGNLYSSQRDYVKAISFYERAIKVNPQLGDAHYRLGVAYDRTGNRDKAQQEFRLHDKITKLEAEEVENERREVKQFLVTVPAKPTYPPAN
jgi:tetratricopeptide (TPR) repeat protein